MLTTQILIGIAGTISVIAIYFWLVRSKAE
jgi:hypothetical protein